MKPRFVCRIALVTCLLCPSFALAEPLDAEAQKHFDAGLAYVDDPVGSKWEEALKEFRAAYEISHNWRLQNNIALCALNLERDGEAIEAYQEYLSHGGEEDLTPKKRKQIEVDIATLSASLVTVKIATEPAEAMLFDERKNTKGELVVNSYPIKSGTAKLGLHPGHHKVTIEAPGYVAGTWAFEAEPASNHEHTFKLVSEKQTDAQMPLSASTNVQISSEPPQATKRGIPTGVYIGLAATGVFAGAATVTGVLALNKNKEYDKATDSAEEDSLKKSGKSLALISDISIGAAILSAGVTAYLYFSAPKSAPPTTGKSNFNITPVATPSAAGFAMTGTF